MNEPIVILDSQGFHVRAGRHLAPRPEPRTIASSALDAGIDTHDTCLLSGVSGMVAGPGGSRVSANRPTPLACRRSARNQRRCGLDFPACGADTRRKLGIDADSSTGLRDRAAATAAPDRFHDRGRVLPPACSRIGPRPEHPGCRTMGARTSTPRPAQNTHLALPAGKNNSSRTSRNAASRKRSSLKCSPTPRSR